MTTSTKRLLSSSKLWNVFAILAMLNVLDAASTAVLVAQFGPDVEANLIVRYWIEQYGVLGMYMFKFVVLAFLGLVISVVVRKHLHHRAATIAHNVMWVLNALFLLVVINNVILVSLAINI